MNAARPRLFPWLRSATWLCWALLWIGGTAAHVLFGDTPGNAGWTAPVFLFIASALVVMSSPQSDRPALWVTFVVGFGIEVLGVKTGYPFGRYAYSPVLGFSLWGVPVVMGGAWMVLLAFVRQLRLPVWAGATVMAGIDLVIDPLAANALHFWHWAHAGPYYGVPLSNFVGWFLVSVASLFLLRSRPARSGGVMTAGVAVLLFFTVLGFAHRLILPACLGLGLCAAACLRCILETWRQDLSAELA